MGLLRMVAIGGAAVHGVTVVRFEGVSVSAGRGGWVGPFFLRQDRPHRERYLYLFCVVVPIGVTKGEIGEIQRFLVNFGRAVGYLDVVV